MFMYELCNLGVVDASLTLIGSESIFITFKGFTPKLMDPHPNGKDDPTIDSNKVRQNDLEFLPETQEETQANGADTTNNFSKILSGMNFGNHEKIICEIVALRIPPFPENLKIISKSVVSAGFADHNLVPSACEVLKNLPMRSTPPFDAARLKSQVMLTLIDQIHTHCNEPARNGQALNLISFIEELHARSVIDDINLTAIVEHLIGDTEKESASDGSRLYLLITFIKSFKNCIARIDENSLIKAENALQKCLNMNTNAKIRKIFEDVLTILRRKPPRNETSEVNGYAHLNGSKLSHGIETTSQATSVETGPLSLFKRLKLKSKNQYGLNKYLETLDVDTSPQMRGLALNILEAAMYSQNFTEVLKLPEILENNFSSSSKALETSFKDSLREMAQTSFYSELYNARTI